MQPPHRIEGCLFRIKMPWSGTGAPLDRSIEQRRYFDNELDNQQQFPDPGVWRRRPVVLALMFAWMQAPADAPRRRDGSGVDGHERPPGRALSSRGGPLRPALPPFSATLHSSCGL